MKPMPTSQQQYVQSWCEKHMNEPNIMQGEESRSTQCLVHEVKCLLLLKYFMHLSIAKMRLKLGFLQDLSGIGIYQRFLALIAFHDHCSSILKS